MKKRAVGLSKTNSLDIVYLYCYLPLAHLVYSKSLCDCCPSYFYFSLKLDRRATEMRDLNLRIHHCTQMFVGPKDRTAKIHVLGLHWAAEVAYES